MDEGTWQATIYGVTKSWTRLTKQQQTIPFEMTSTDERKWLCTNTNSILLSTCASKGTLCAVSEFSQQWFQIAIIHTLRAKNLRLREDE